MVSYSCIMLTVAIVNVNLVKIGRPKLTLTSNNCVV